MSSKRLETAKKYIAGFATLDIQTFSSLYAENYIHQFAPASLNLPESLDKQGMNSHLKDIRNILAGFPVTAKEYVENESSNQVTVWATSQTIFRDDVKDDGISQKEWVYEGEYIFMLWMDETGEKITRVVEFLDSKATDDKLRPLMKRARENRKKRTAEIEK
jgi:hypothetical protein